jgi:hypothetical protein
MAYIINKTNGANLATVDDGTVNDTACSLVLIGRNVSTYGERQNENVVKLLENFANSTAPTSPLDGQLWFDSTNNQLKLRFGSDWRGISNFVKSTSQPSGLSNGDLWYNTTTGQVKIKQGSNFKLIGPLSIIGGGDTQIVAEIFTDIYTVDHEVLSFYVNGVRLAVMSSDTQYSTTSYSGFATVKPGVNLNTTLTGVVFNVTANNAQALNSLTSSQFMRSDADTATTGNLAVTGNVSAAKIVGDHYGDGGWLSNIRAANIVGTVSVSGTASTALQLQTPRNIALTGNVTGNVNFDGSADVTFTASLAEERLKLTGGTLTGQLNANSGLTVSTVSTGNLIYATTTRVGILTNNPVVALDVNGAIRMIPQVNGSTSGSITIDGTYTNHQINLSGSASINLQNFSQPGQIVRIVLVGTENQVNWGADVYWPNGAAPNLANGPRRIAVVTLMRPNTISTNITYRPDTNFIVATYVCY